MIAMLIMLGLLVGPYFLLGLAPSLKGKRSLRGCLGLTLIFCIAGVGHFIIPAQLAEMIPPAVPYRVELIYLSGVVEILAGLALLPSRTRYWAGWVVVVMLLVLLPFNVYAAVERIPLAGHEWGPIYLLLRVPLQLLMAGWAYWFAVRLRPS